MNEIWGESVLRDAVRGVKTSSGQFIPLNPETIEAVLNELDRLRGVVKMMGVPVEDALALQRAVGAPLTATFVEVVREAVAQLANTSKKCSECGFVWSIGCPECKRDRQGRGHD